MFLTSTNRFSAHNTFVVLERIVRFIVRWIPGQQIDLLHTRVRKSPNVTQQFIPRLLLFHASRRGSLKSCRLRWVVTSLSTIVAIAARVRHHQSFCEPIGGNLAEADGGLAHSPMLFLLTFCNPPSPQRVDCLPTQMSPLLAVSSNVSSEGSEGTTGKNPRPC